MNVSADFFRLLGDAQRIRILRLLMAEKLNVTELTAILGAAQSGVSRHLRLLREAGLVLEDRESGWTYYHVDPDHLPDDIARLWPALEDPLRTLPGSRQDDVRLREVLHQRREEFRETPRQGISPGRSWTAWARTLGYLVPPHTVADLGCGEGYLTLEVARWARKVIAVDKSRAMLRRAKQLAQRHNVRNIQFKYGSVERAPLPDASVDVVLIAQVLHCLTDPAAGLKECFRILKPKGTLLFQELRTHQEEWVREKLGDSRLGFQEKELNELLRKRGFKSIRIDIGARRRGDPFTIIIGSANKTAETQSFKKKA